CLQYDNLLRTF
nr:immunoglobulin light chain junction region [Mus musculus]NSL97270.1 immunoglobulin light chain junction region [Mus musculus]NSL97838.1 immunoglobulin light chain junction region [Mus musculus]NSL98089.1 immunoglobulin light chain junction region [Mus musculus]NSL98280.1 immunoglobulin light chain junction region [Mus musculus]